jgi:HK97 family phage major capsid protein
MDPRRERLKAIATEARAIAAKAEADGRDFTAAESAKVKSLYDEAQKIADAIKARETDDATINELLGLSGDTGASFRMDGRKDGLELGGRGARWAKATAGILAERLAGTKDITPSGSITAPAMAEGIVRREDRPLTLLDLVTIVPLEGTDTFTYRRESARTVNARSVAVGTLKPTSVYGIEKISDTVKTIAHLSEMIDNTLLADVDELELFLGDVMAVGVLEALEDMLINAVGGRDDFDGVLELSGTQAQAFTTDALTTARKAVTKLEVAHITGALAWVLSPARWEAFELEKDAETYVLGDPGTAGRTLPVDTARRRLWGHPVVLNTELEDDTAILGDWSPSSVRVREREGVTLTWSDAVADEVGTGFETNRKVWRAEGRFGAEWRRPYAFVIADLAAGS